jgi:hypothetical protein
MMPEERIETFERTGLLGRRLFFRIVDARNNEILAQSQPYKTPLGRDVTARRLAKGLGCQVVDGNARGQR